jgi:hypothetical protein
MIGSWLQSYRRDAASTTSINLVRLCEESLDRSQYSSCSLVFPEETGQDLCYVHLCF